MRKTYVIVVVLAIAGLAAGCKSLKDIAVTSPDMSAIADGTYRGTATVGPVKVVVDVDVRDGVMTAIELIQHRNGRGKPAEAVVPRVIEAQNLDVDIVSGATASSKAILLAVQNAFLDGDPSDS